MSTEKAKDLCSESSCTKETGGTVSGSASDTRTRLVKAATQTHNLVAAFVVGRYKPEDTPNADDEIDNETVDVFQPWILSKDSVDIRPIDLITIEGDITLKSKIRELVEEFEHIFVNVLPPEPARIPPFEIIVDETKWNTNRSRGPPRVQSADKEKEIYQQVRPCQGRDCLRPLS